MNANDWTSAIADGVQVAAIAVGGTWAYYKFARGRTFHRRAEVTVTAELLRRGDFVALRATPVLVNTGAADIPFRARVVRVYAFAADDVDDKGRPDWQEVANIPVFGDHDSIESQERICDDVLIALPMPVFSGGAVAIRATCLVYERREKPGGICWTAHAIVPLGERGGEGETAAVSPDQEKSGAGTPQREADEEEIRQAGQDLTRQREASEEEIQQAERDTENK